MAIKHKSGKYQCSYCLKLHDDPIAADTCRENHNLIYIPFTRKGLQSLITFLYTKNEKDLDVEMVQNLLKYNRLRAE